MILAHDHAASGRHLNEAFEREHIQRLEKLAAMEARVRRLPPRQPTSLKRHLLLPRLGEADPLIPALAVAFGDLERAASGSPAGLSPSESASWGTCAPIPRLAEQASHVSYLPILVRLSTMQSMRQILWLGLSALAPRAGLWHARIIDYLWPGCGFCRASGSFQPWMRRLCSMRKRGQRPFPRAYRFCSCLMRDPEHNAGSWTRL